MQLCSSLWIPKPIPIWIWFFFWKFWNEIMYIMALTSQFLRITIGNFNTRSKNWYRQNKTSFEDNSTESITSQFGLYQLINEPTHLLENSTLCTDLIFTSQPNFVVELGVHPSLHPNFHQQIVFAISTTLF